MFKSNVVPVGEDQVQHIEIARDIADAFNRQYGEILTLPEALAQPAVPGIDGRKMSKSYDNTIPLFASQSQMKKRVMRIVTDSKKPEDPKNPLECNIFALYQHFASPEQLEQTKKKYLEGGLAYGELKKELLAMIEAEVAPKREKYEELISDTDRLDAILMEGAEKARKRARALLEKVRLAVVGRA
jgi:tryptophanyl-tRNA synthetase